MTAKFLKPLGLLGIAAALLLAGCATTGGKIAGVAVPADSNVAIFSTPYYPYDGIDLDGSFLGVLRKYGLTPSSKAGAPFVLQIGFTQPDSATVVCSLVLLQQGKPVISARGTHLDPATPDAGAPGGREGEAANRVAAFLAARQDFEARARGAGAG